MIVLIVRPVNFFLFAYFATLLRNIFIKLQLKLKKLACGLQDELFSNILNELQRQKMELWNVEQMDSLRHQTDLERKERARAVFRVTENIAQEREGIVTQVSCSGFVIRLVASWGWGRGFDPWYYIFPLGNLKLLIRCHQTFSKTTYPQKQSGLISLFEHALCVLHQPMSVITSVCSSHNCARGSVGWISVNKNVLYELHWLFELQSRISQMCGIGGHENRWECCS